MARVTVEDCIKKVSNRFDLVMLAAQRARQVTAGSPLTIDRGRDKNPVVALREIAGETVSVEDLEEAFIQEMRKFIPGDEPEDELMELLAEEQGVAGQERQEEEISQMAVEGEETIVEEEIEPVGEEEAEEFEEAMAELAEEELTSEESAEE